MEGLRQLGRPLREHRRRERGDVDAWNPRCWPHDSGRGGRFEQPGIDDGQSAPTKLVTSQSLAASDTTPPSTPTGLAVSSAGQTSIALSWNASSDNVGVAGYGVYKNGSLAASPAGTSYTLTGLSCGTSYAVAVDAFDAAGNRSGKATITTSTAACPDTQPPSAPGGLAVSFVAQSAVTLSWAASSDNVGVVGYDLYLGALSVGTSAQTSYAFSGLSCGTAYTLGVDAYDAAGQPFAGFVADRHHECVRGYESAVCADKSGGVGLDEFEYHG